MSAFRFFLAAALTAVPATANAYGPVCATTEQAGNIKDYYTKSRPGVPLPVPSRYFNVTEFVVASALPTESSLGVEATPEVTKQIWASIDGWGASTKVTLVLSPGSKHAFAFPSLVPVTQSDAKDGYLDVYADGGKGVHSHLQLDHVKAIYATDLPTKDPKFRTRGVSFFGPSGDLILGVYASINTAGYDQKAVDGFGRTWNLLKGMPRHCE